MSVSTYWLGKRLPLDQLWRDYDTGQAYVEKVGTRPLHRLRLSFAGHPRHLPLFDHEVIYKTVKGTFHEVKVKTLTPDEYDEAVPIFLYRIERGSAGIEFLAELTPLLTWVVALGGASLWYRKMLAADQAFDHANFDFLRTHFPNAEPRDLQAYMKALTTFERRKVLHRLIGQGLYRVEISQQPHVGTRPQSQQHLVDMSPIVSLPPESQE